jgi:putative endonuclease
MAAMNRKDTGTAGEKIACNYLTDKGYSIIETNYRCREGELDIVARRQDTLVFVEVRTKKSYRFGTPEESITALKKEHLRAAAEHYLQEHQDLPVDRRIDVIAIMMNVSGKLNRIDHIENAIEDC